MKKKIIAIAAVLAMTVGLMASLTACGGSGSSGGGKEGEAQTLTLWTHNDEDSWNESYQGIVDAYNAEHPDVQINIESFPYDEYESKVQTALMSKEGGADLYELWGGWGVDYAPSGALEQLPEDMEKDVRDNCYENTYGALESDGHLFGIPMEYNIECGGLIVNLKLMEEAGAEIPKDWNELMQAAKMGTKMKGDDVEVKGFDFVNWDGVMYLWTSMILSQGANYLNEDGTFNVTSDEAKKAWEELAALVTDDKVTTLSGLDDGSDIEGYQELYAGQAMMVPRGPWCLAEGQNDFGLEFGKDYSYVEMPFYSDEKKFATETGWSMAVAAGLSDEKKAAAFDFLNYFFSDEVIMSHNLACGQIPAKKEVAQSDEYLKSFEYAAPLVPILDGGQFIGLFNTDVFKENVNNVFSAYCKDQYESTDAALAELEKKLNEM
ncbi:MAG: extracellular solute-binding protein [Lachnospiraceae bacterium]|nr:extracellular solute-binding protein [Lachnospiraceae bacterium]